MTYELEASACLPGKGNGWMVMWIGQSYAHQIVYLSYSKVIYIYENNYYIFFMIISEWVKEIIIKYHLDKH